MDAGFRAVSWGRSGRCGAPLPHPLPTRGRGGAPVGGGRGGGRREGGGVPGHGPGRRRGADPISCHGPVSGRGVAASWTPDGAAVAGGPDRSALLPRGSIRVGWLEAARLPELGWVMAPIVSARSSGRAFSGGQGRSRAPIDRGVRRGGGRDPWGRAPPLPLVGRGWGRGKAPGRGLSGCGKRRGSGRGRSPARSPPPDRRRRRGRGRPPGRRRPTGPAAPTG